MNNVIKLTQDRVYETGLRIKSGDGYYYLSPQEKLLFGIKQTTYQTAYLLQKTLTHQDYDAVSDSYTLSLTTEETALEPGQYCYDVALQRADGELEKIIGCTPLEVIKSVVRSEDVC